MKRALLAGALLWLVACSEKKALPSPGPNAQEVTFDTQPPGAQVTVDGVFAGQTPLKVKLDPGRYRVRLSMSAYFPEEQVLTVPYGEPVRFFFALIRSH